MRILVRILRVITGLLFIFSGLIKANDPLGLTYKMQEFLGVLHLNFLAQVALPLSLVMILLEVLGGAALLTGFRIRVFAPLVLLLSLFFTFITGYAYFSGKVKECGCFGDCIPLSAGASFAKDLILLVMILVIYSHRRRTTLIFGRKLTDGIMILGLVVPMGLEWWALNHLPPVDCLPYSVGKNIAREMEPPAHAVPDQYESVMVYEKNGKQQSFSSNNYPWKDSSWHFVSRQDKLVRKGNNIPVIEDFALFDFQGTEVTSTILHDPAPIFLLMVRDVDQAGYGWAPSMDSLQQYCQTEHFKIYGVTA
ncbi:MAG TPA: BT_3928 family protein, partial [Chitinophagaceae bacterium]|nr:BT_3928 family protein [Chitinophagaceae bacterium]